MSDLPPSGELRGHDQPLDAVDYEIDMVEFEEGHCMVAVTFDLGFAELDVQFNSEDAEEFIVEFRDELVHAKQAQLEWETNTDPETGVAETDGGDRC